MNKDWSWKTLVLAFARDQINGLSAFTSMGFLLFFLKTSFGNKTCFKSLVSLIRPHKGFKLFYLVQVEILELHFLIL